MKIDNTHKPVGSTPGGDQRPKATGQASPAAPAGAQVQLSSRASGMQKAEQIIAATPVVDQARVDELKQAISDGHFQVNPDKVANALIDSVRQMLAAQPGSA